MDGRMSNNTKAYFKQGLIIVMNYSGLNLNVPTGSCLQHLLFSWWYYSGRLLNLLEEVYQYRQAFKDYSLALCLALLAASSDVTASIFPITMD